MTKIRSAEALVRRKAEELFPGSPMDQAWFLGLAKQESQFDPSAYNPLGDAYGIFQFAGDMRRAYGLDRNSPIEAQLDAAGDYLKKLYQKHAGNWTKVLAEHYMGLPRFNRSQMGKADAEVRSFYGSHLPKVVANARQYAREIDQKPPMDITLTNAPAPVSSVDSVAQLTSRTPAPRAPVPSLDAAGADPQQAYRAKVIIPMLLNLLARGRNRPPLFGPGL